MVSYYSNTLCVEGGWLYGESNIMSESNYKQLVARGRMVKMCVGGNGRRAWIAFKSIPERFQKKIVDLIGDPYAAVKHIILEDYIKLDFVAESYFRSYTLEDETALPLKTQEEYTHTAMVLNACHYIATNVVVQKKFGGKSKMWRNMAEAVAELPAHTYKCKLPRNYRDLKAKTLAYKGIKLSKRYPTEGYEGLIHKGFLNNSAQKLTEDGSKWVLARWCNQVNKCATIAQLHEEYNAHADREGWKRIKSDKTLYNFLNSEEIKPLWWGYRYGELEAKEKFDFKLKTKLPSMRDSLWYSDGTKLNYYYLNADGKMETCQVYEVMDAYSEVLLGYHISKTEDYVAQYGAFKMATQIAEHRPYQIAHDNQGGHKKLKSGNFLTKVARIQTATKPYNGNSKTIENAFYRLQSQFLKRDWFFTGQNITAKKKESKANMEFVLANTANLPTLDEVKAVYAKRRKEWNEAKHPKTGKTRIETYLNSQNPETKRIDILDIVDLFWITRKVPVTCDASGISFKEKKAEYSYMVYTDHNMPDLEFLNKSIDKKFTIKFDPEDMSHIRLYEDTPLGLRFVTVANTKIETHRGIQEQEDWEAKYMRSVITANDAKRIERRDAMEELLEQHGMSAEQQGLNRPNLKGIERRPRGRKKVQADSYGEHTKRLSNQDWDDEAEETKEVKLSNLI